MVVVNIITFVIVTPPVFIIPAAIVSFGTIAKSIGGDAFTPFSRGLTEAARQNPESARGIAKGELMSRPE